jgi:V8-like Glu-specific endopeptidase
MQKTSNAIEINTIRKLLEEQKKIEEEKKMNKETLIKLREKERTTKKIELDKKKEELKKNENYKTLTNKEKILYDIAKSLETKDNLYMSELKNIPNITLLKTNYDFIGIGTKYMKNEEEEKKSQNSQNNLQKEKLNYPLSAIGLLKCDYGNGFFVYGTGTLISPSIVLTCAHILYNPVMKKKAENVTFYMNLNNGQFLNESHVDTFVYPEIYEMNENKVEDDYGVCVLHSNLGDKGGYLGICPFDKEDDLTAYFYGYVNSNIKKYFDPNIDALNYFNIQGIEMDVRLDESEKKLLYVGVNTKTGQDGSPIFKIKNYDDVNLNYISTDIQIIGIDCSINKMLLQEKNVTILKSNKLIQLDEIYYQRLNRAVPITEKIYYQITRWIDFYTNIIPKGKIDDHLSMTKSMTINDFNESQFIDTKMLNLSFSKLFGKDINAIFNAYNLETIRVLDLNNNNINEDGILILVNHEKLCNNLLDLNLKENNLNSTAIDYFTRVEYNELTKLNLGYNYIGPKGCNFLYEYGVFPKLTEFDVSHNEILSEGLKYLVKIPLKNLHTFHCEGNSVSDLGCNYLSKGEFSNLQNLYLSNNEITNSGVIYLNKNYLKKLNVLELEWNDITNEGIYMLGYYTLSQINSFNINNNSIGTDGAIIIANILPNDLKELNIRKNNILTKGIEYLSTVSLNKLEILNVSDNYICDMGLYFISKGNFIQLQILDVSINNITHQGVKYLADATFKHSLIDLNISGNSLGNKGIQFLCFSKLIQIKKLDISLNNGDSISARHLMNGQLNYINELYLFSNSLLSVGVQFLMNSKFIPNLKILDLSNNEIGNNGCLFIAKGSLISLEILNLSNNKIENEGINNLSKGEYFKLIDLNLENNEISSEGFNILANGFLSGLKFLRVKGNDLMTENDVDILENGNFKKIDKQNGFVFINFTIINNSVIRYCLKNPDDEKLNNNVIIKDY